jgi:hypothetical protein
MNFAGRNERSALS